MSVTELKSFRTVVEHIWSATHGAELNSILFKFLQFATHMEHISSFSRSRHAETTNKGTFRGFWGKHYTLEMAVHTYHNQSWSFGNDGLFMVFFLCLNYISKLRKDWSKTRANFRIFVRESVGRACAASSFARYVPRVSTPRPQVNRRRSRICSL